MKTMIAEAKDARREITALALIAMVIIAAAWYGFWSGQDAFSQEKYNSAWVWCESQPDTESCRWGAYTALSPALNK